MVRNLASTPMLHVTFAASFLILCHFWLNLRQPKPYMDELFHVPQAQHFCRAVVHGTWPSYHPAITTLPGVYILSATIAVISRSQVVCETRWLRALSAAMALVCLPLLAQIIALLRARWQLLQAVERNDEPRSGSNALIAQTSNWSLALILWLNPVFLFYSHLYYTDTSAMAWMLLTWRLSLKGHNTASALAGFAASLTRQTNMIWHAFIVVDYAIYTVAMNAHMPIHVSPALSFAARDLLPRIWAHICAGVIYILFLIINGGVVLGDRENHTFSLHYAMLAYFLGFHAISHLPFQLQQLREIAGSLKRRRDPITTSLLAGAYVAIIGAVQATGDKVHGFILADNRHYTFYIYKRWLLRSHAHRLVVTPLYMWTILSCYAETGVSCARQVCEPALDGVVLMCAAVTLVPSLLLEPRYFVIGSTLLSVRRLARMQTRCCSPRMMTWTCAALTAVNVALVFVFSEMSFARAADAHMPTDDSPGRFMF